MKFGSSSVTAFFAGEVVAIAFFGVDVESDIFGEEEGIAEGEDDFFAECERECEVFAAGAGVGAKLAIATIAIRVKQMIPVMITARDFIGVLRSVIIMP